MGERKMNPESETAFGSPHLPFCHFLFYPLWLRPQAVCAKQSHWEESFKSEVSSVKLGKFVVGIPHHSSILLFHHSSPRHSCETKPISGRRK